MVISRRCPRLLQQDRGAAAVEAALVLPLLLMVVFGIIDFGRMLNTQIKVTAAAREAARAVALGLPIADRVSTVMGGDAATAQVVEDCSGSNDDARVTVTQEFHFATPVAVFGTLAGPVNLSSTGVMPCRG